ncbi:MAG: DNA-binding protein WhiA [Lachnospiraceae bacterium]|nr:DNA-binding protein WhiA [Lachnospiraceae bacterium]
MSFSKNVKEELSKHIPQARHCQIAEIAAIVNLCGKIEVGQKETQLKIYTDNLTVARKYFMLIKETFHGEVAILNRNGQGNKNSYALLLKEQKLTDQILKAIKVMREDYSFVEPQGVVDRCLLQNTCCKRAFIRGVFLTNGSMSDPEKTYHFEIIMSTESRALQIQEVIRSFGIDAKIVIRKKYYVVYVKDGSQIVDILNIMEAHKALMDLENIRILKEMRNSINRKVNCETANINKTVTAATKQIDDIVYIKEQMGFSDLSPGLEEVALLRMEHPDASLKELGEMLSQPLGKSGVNHRLRKLSEIADRLREQKEELENGKQKNYD